MDKKQKIFIGIGVFVFIVLVGFIGYKFMSTPSLEDQSKDKSSDNKPALETNIDNEVNEKNAEEEKQQKKEEKSSKSSKKNDSKKNDDNEKQKKEDEPKNKPNKKDLEKKAKRFVEIQNESKTPDNVKSLKSDMKSIATKDLTNKLFNDHMSADEDSHFKAKINKTNVIKDGKKNAEVNVKYDLHGRSPETKKQEKLKENIEESVYFKYEDGQYKVDRYKQ